jgi:DNA-binding CsgD family transcriptional regulator
VDAQTSLLAQARDQARCVVFHGPPGIGKTHAWAQLVEAARDRGFRVLIARPSEAEARLVGSALVDLFTEVDDDVLRQLPGPQHAALAEALRRTSGETRADPTTVAAAFAGAITLLAEQTPVALAVDDIQWLDRETADLLAFAARRLPQRDVLLLLTLRTEPGVPEPGLLAAAASALPLQRESVAPLDEARLVDVVRERTGIRLAGEDRRRVLDLSEGNPLFAIELVRHLGAGPADAVRLPESLQAVTGAALDALPPATVAALAAAAALGAPTLGQLSTLGLDTDLAPAERAQLISVRDRRIRFAHPLYAAAAYERLSGGELLDLHGRLATVVDDPEERARHLALAAPLPDAELAKVLDDVADRARGRAALWAALDAVRLAISLSPDVDELVFGRRLRLGQTLRQVGESELAREELTRLTVSEADPDLRAAAFCELALILLARNGADVALPAITEGLALARSASVRADLHLAAAVHCELFTDRVAWHAEQALAALAELPEPDPVRAHRAQLRRLEADWMAARAQPDLEVVARIPDGLTLRPEQMLELVLLRFDWQIVADETELARASLSEVLELADLVGDDARAVHAILFMVNQEESAGELMRAFEWLPEAESRAMRSQLSDYHTVVGQTRQRLEVITGRSEPALSDGSSSWAALVDAATRGLRAYLQGDFGGTVAALEPMLGNFETWGIHHPRLPRGAEYLIESLIHLGRLDEAEKALRAREERAERTASRSSRGTNARCRALLLAEYGDEQAALASAAVAVDTAGQLGREFDRARALLTRGQVGRRFKRRGEARRSFEEAAEVFERMGAGAFAARARDELTRVGGRAAKSGLTSTEQRIAELTARGLTTRETAAELFLSPKTVSNQLTAVYRKLGVRNRSELAARLASGSTDRP